LLPFVDGAALGSLGILEKIGLPDVAPGLGGEAVIERLLVSLPGVRCSHPHFSTSQLIQQLDLVLKLEQL
jgi:hypothetical protein